MKTKNTILIFILLFGFVVASVTQAQARPSNDGLHSFLCGQARDGCNIWMIVDKDNNIIEYTRQTGPGEFKLANTFDIPSTPPGWDPVAYQMYRTTSPSDKERWNMSVNNPMTIEEIEALNSAAYPVHDDPDHPLCYKGSVESKALEELASQPVALISDGGSNASSSSSAGFAASNAGSPGFGGLPQGTVIVKGIPMTPSGERLYCVQIDRLVSCMATWRTAKEIHELRTHGHWVMSSGYDANLSLHERNMFGPPIPQPTTGGVDPERHDALPTRPTGTGTSNEVLTGPDFVQPVTSPTPFPLVDISPPRPLLYKDPSPVFAIRQAAPSNNRKSILSNMASKGETIKKITPKSSYLRLDFHSTSLRVE